MADKGKHPELEAARLYQEEKMSLRGVGEALGVSYEQVRKWLDALGVERRSRAEGIRLATQKGAPAHRSRCARAGCTERVGRGNKFCSMDCYHEHRSSGHTSGRKIRRGHDDQLWIVDPRTGRHMRYARYLMQERLDRELGPREWVVVLDGNPDNLTDDNLAVMSPTEARAFWNEQKGE